MKNEFPVSIYGKLEKFTDTISRARVRIFYKGLNRNSTYITEEFAEKLINTLSYAPVKGIYDSEDSDYTDHGKKRNEGRIYGIVPADKNFAWEKHTDEDGETREYACCDVLLYTALYGEAEKIVGSSQSMEIYPPSIKGKWIYMSGKKVYQYEEGCFLGLQVLGQEVEPCFEGAAFFSMYKQIEDIYAKLNEYKNIFEKGGNKFMGEPNFELSHDQLHNVLWNLLNADYYNEENDWKVRYCINEIYDSYAVVRDYAEQKYYKWNYTKDNENDSVALGEKEECFYVVVTEAEKQALVKYRESEGTYEKIEENFTQMKADIETLTNEKEELNTKLTTVNTEFEALKTSNEETVNALTEANGKIEDMNGQIATYTEQATNLQATIDTLTSENEGLKQFKLDTEIAEKKALVNSYSDKLDTDVINEYTNEKLADMSLEDIEKELCFKLVKSNPSVFSKGEPTPQYIPKNDGPKSGLDEILSKYKK